LFHVSQKTREPFAEMRHQRFNRMVHCSSFAGRALNEVGSDAGTVENAAHILGSASVSTPVTPGVLANELDDLAIAAGGLA
jgi:hypothetical protein